VLKPVHGEDGRGNYVVAYCQEGGPAADSRQVPTKSGHQHPAFKTSDIGVPKDGISPGGPLESVSAIYALP
jgi:hypothetical protein